MPTDSTTTPEPATSPSGSEPSADLLRTEDLTVHFAVRGGIFGTKQYVHAVDGVSLTLGYGETLGLVGESGSGKTTLGYTILGRYKPTAGRIHVEGTDVTGYRGEQLRLLRRNMQMVFQDPYSSLNPRMRIGETVGEPLVAHKRLPKGPELTKRVGELLERCGMPASAADRYPDAFSGGQRQRIGIARALALEPKLLVADEPTSALDVAVQAQVINLLQDLQGELGLSYLFISHDLSLVRHISHRIAIMYLGQVVEIGPAEAVFGSSLHPYTQALISAIPIPDADTSWHRERVVLGGEVPSPIDPPAGCRFSTRCPIAVSRCFLEAPSLELKRTGHWTACWEVPGSVTEVHLTQTGAPTQTEISTGRPRQ